ncbi:MAG: hypothetical protein B6I24_07540 [Bacteroidetes bacterium 4572_128]|nr:MAG: hypothetical protein B6I24_07540 [Bacteroidetes bacterium 4572_128]
MTIFKKNFQPVQTQKINVFLKKVFGKNFFSINFFNIQTQKIVIFLKNFRFVQVENFFPKPPKF